MLTPPQAHYLHELRATAHRERIPVISANNAAFVCQLLAQYKPVRMLEIGSAIGVSSALFASCIAAWGGQLCTVEISVPTQAAAVKHLTALGLNNVDSVCADARQLMQTWADQASPRFDCIFIDAQKSQTHVFYEAALNVLSPRGMIIVDDVWKFRHKMPLFYTLLKHKMQAYSLHFVDAEDATMLIQP